MAPGSGASHFHKARSFKGTHKSHKRLAPSCCFASAGTPGHAPTILWPAAAFEECHKVIQALAIDFVKDEVLQLIIHRSCEAFVRFRSSPGPAGKATDFNTPECCRGVSESSFICRRAINGGHRYVVETHVDCQLSAVMHEMVYG